ncbi:MAG: glycosyltransferase family 2 protein [Pseudomonadota bacterium]
MESDSSDTALNGRQPRVLLIAPMRNEGAALLEWVAWQHLLGFDDILVLTNDCSDGSDRLLDRLAARGYLAHARHQPAEGEFALRSAFRTAKAHPLVETADWVMICDADEFPVIHLGEGQIHDLIAAHGDSALGIALHWKSFGDNGRQRWEDGFVRQLYTRAAEGQHRANMRFKSVFRAPGMFAGFASHAPFGFQGRWGGRNRWVNSMGEPLPGCVLMGEARARATALRRINHGGGQINHYVIKAQECTLERRAKWALSDRDARYGEEFLARYNINAAEDRSALQREAAFQEIYDALIADPETRRLHHLACAWYAGKLAELQGQEPDADPRVRRHRAAAAS